MNTLSRFEQDRQAQWSELEGLLAGASGSPERLGPTSVRRLASLYRSASADLATARRRFPGDPVVDRLEDLVRRAQAAVYERRARRGNLAEFFADRYWQLVWHRRRPLALAALLLFGSGTLMALWAQAAPEVVSSLVPPQFLWVTEAETTDQGLGTVGLAGFSTYVLVNNIRVTLMAFVAGITWGVGTALLVAYNGVLLGSLAGLAAGAGNLRLLGEAILAHGILELTCVAVAGAAGLSLGRSMLRPGHLTRTESLTEEARSALFIALGTAPWLVLAGIVEGYASRVGLSLLPTASIGVTLGAIWWGMLVWRGPTRPDQIRARRFARR